MLIRNREVPQAIRVLEKVVPDSALNWHKNSLTNTTPDNGQVVIRFEDRHNVAKGELNVDHHMGALGIARNHPLVKRPYDWKYSAASTIFARLLIEEVIRKQDVLLIADKTPLVKDWDQYLGLVIFTAFQQHGIDGVAKLLLQTKLVQTMYETEFLIVSSEREHVIKPKECDEFPSFQAMLFEPTTKDLSPIVIIDAACSQIPRKPDVMIGQRLIYLALTSLGVDLHKGVITIFITNAPKNSPPKKPNTKTYEYLNKTHAFVGIFKIHDDWTNQDEDLTKLTLTHQAITQLFMPHFSCTVSDSSRNNLLILSRMTTPKRQQVLSLNPNCPNHSVRGDSDRPLPAHDIYHYIMMRELLEYGYKESKMFSHGEASFLHPSKLTNS